MSDLEAIARALKAADAAGNVEDAKRLAQAYAAAQAKPDFAGKVSGGVKSTEADYNPTTHGIKLGARSTMEGVAGIADLLTSPLRAGAELLGMDRPGTLTELAGRGADKLGLPRPNNATERVQADVGRALSGGAVTMGAGGLASQLPGMVGRVGATLSAQPGMQALSAATGATASGLTRENGGGTAA